MLNTNILPDELHVILFIIVHCSFDYFGLNLFPSDMVRNEAIFIYFMVRLLADRIKQ